MAPTVMVSRIARVSSRDQGREIVTAHISNLRFQAASGDTAAASMVFAESSVVEENRKQSDSLHPTELNP